METFWERLDEATSSGITRKNLAELAGISISTISMWKKRKSYPTADVAVRLAEGLGLTVEYLVTGKKPGMNVPRRIRPIVEDILVLNENELTTVGTLARCLAQEARASQKKVDTG